MLITMFEPVRQETKSTIVSSSEEEESTKSSLVKDDQKTTIWEIVSFLFTDAHTALLLLGASVRYMGGYAIAGYLPTFYESKWPAKTTTYSEINAFVVAMGGFLSSFLGGKLTTAWLESRNSSNASERWPGAKKANYYMPIIGCLSAIPFMLITLYSNNFYVSLCVGLLGEYLTAESWFGPYMSALTAGVPSEMRATAVATMMFTATFMGSLISYVIGTLYDFFVDDKGDDSAKVLTWLLLASVVGAYTISAQLFFAASRFAPQQKRGVSNEMLTEKTSLLDEEGA